MTGAEFALVASIASAVGSVVQGISAFQQGQFQARVAEQQADFARKQAEIDAKEFKRDQQRLLGQARATRGASGVLLSEGSPLLVDDETIEEILFQTERVRRGGQVESARLQQSAQASRAAGRSGLVGGVFGAGSSLLGADFSSFGGGTTQFGGLSNLSRSGASRQAAGSRSLSR